MVVLNRVVQNAVYQSAGGMVVGSAIDGFFPKSTDVTSSNALKVGAEALAEIVLISAVSAAYFNWVGARIPGEDATGKLAFMIALPASIPNLNSKISNLSSYLGGMLSNHYMGERVPESNQPTQAGYIYANNSPNNPDVPSPTGGEEGFPFGE